MRIPHNNKGDGGLSAQVLGPLSCVCVMMRTEGTTMARRPKRSEANIRLVPTQPEPEPSTNVVRVPVESARLVTIDEDDALWTTSPDDDETGYTMRKVRGAMVRLIPPPEMTALAVQQAARYLKAVGAAAVKVQPNRHRPTNPITGDRSPVAVVPTVRAVVAQMVEEAHCDGFERDELRDAVEAALTAEGA